MNTSKLSGLILNILFILGVAFLICISLYSLQKVRKYSIKVEYLERSNDILIREYGFTYDFVYFLKTTPLVLNNTKVTDLLWEPLSTDKKAIFLWINENACDKCITESISSLLPYFQLGGIVLNVILDKNPALYLQNSKFVNIWSTETSNPTKSFLNESVPFYFTIDDSGVISNIQFINRMTSIDMGLYLRVIQYYFNK
jgi:hypothetical protein